MRATSLVLAILCLAVATGCEPVEKLPGEAAPEGNPAETVSRPTAATTPAGGSPTTAAATAGGGGEAIRGTDWRNVTLSRVAFMDLGTVRFRNGEAHLDYDNCFMLPGNTKPVYGHFIREEPASAPGAEDALVVIECGGDDLLQALIPVQVDGNERVAVSFIEADRVSGRGHQMTFVSYRIESGGIVVTTVKQPDGRTETRRYGWGGNGWDRL
jgi:hypothetical protein